eukprot:TRINITY_DN1329_c0_g1_i4.p1 TRINITY_DN1329_c0_g1~~TRINITY_DN1329_c0_g1_i4.p1  ORF type:complete len:282 (-),score=108.37 TRINITY_DN1329_c0_g1_i4:295-1140(-)
MPLAPQKIAVDQDAALATPAKMSPDAVGADDGAPSSVEQPLQDAAAGTELAVVVLRPKAKAKSSAFRKQLQEKLAQKSIEEVREEIDSMKEKAAAACAAAAALEEERTREVLAAKEQYEAARGDIDTLIGKELEVAMECKELRRKKAEALQKTQQAYANLMEVQKKVAMLEVFAESRRTMADLEEKRKAAAEAAEAAKRDLAEQRQRDKDAFEAAMQSLAKEMGVKKGKGAGRGLKRAAPGDDASAAAQGEAPATDVPSAPAPEAEAEADAGADVDADEKA